MLPNLIRHQSNGLAKEPLEQLNFTSILSLGPLRRIHFDFAKYTSFLIQCMNLTTGCCLHLTNRGWGLFREPCPSWNSCAKYSLQKTRVLCSMLFAVPSTCGFYKKHTLLWFKNQSKKFRDASKLESIHVEWKNEGENQTNT